MKDLIILCTCGDTLKENIDYDHVINHLEKKLPDATVRIVEHLCLANDKKGIKKLLTSEKPDRILFGACTPQILPHYLNGIKLPLTAFANLREQVAWVTNSQEGGTRKAIVELMSGYTRLHHSSTKTQMRLPKNNQVLIVGGGFAGLLAYITLKRLHYSPYIVERSDVLGGKLLNLTSPLTGEPDLQELFNQTLTSARKDKDTHFLNSRLQKVTGGPRSFSATIRHAPNYIPDSKVIKNKDKIIEICPVQIPNETTFGHSYRKAIYKIPETNEIRISEEDCIFCGKCAELTDAIDLSAKPTSTTLDVGSIIIATGVHEYTPPIENPYLYGSVSNVITQGQLETILKQSDKLNIGEQKIPVKKVHMIQCVGSRNQTNPRCSRLCCTYAIKNALKMKSLGIDVSISYLDIRTPLTEEYLYREARQKGIQFIKGNAASISTNGSTSLTVNLENVLDQETLKIESDLVVLYTALHSDASTEDLADTLNLSISKNGFVDNLYGKLKRHEASRHGIWLLGSVGGIHSLRETAEDAFQVTLDVHKFLQNSSKHGYIPQINEELCTQCRACDWICPAKALTVTSTTITLDPIACKGCGQCQSVCPTGAIELDNSINQSITEQIDQIQATHSALAPKQPFFINFGCFECSYCAADMVGPAGHKLPDNVYQIPQPCGGETSVLHLLTALDRGAKRVLVSTCPEASCHYFNGSRTAHDTVAFTQSILKEIGIEPNRIQHIPVLFSEPLNLVRGMDKLVSD